MSIAANGAFQAKPASEYAHKQTSEKVTIAAQQFVTDEESKEAFGKLNPWRFGILPVLVVIQNDSPNAIRVDKIKFVYALPDGTKIEATPAADLRYLMGAKAPKTVAGPLGGIHMGKGSKNPLAEWEVEGRSFSAKMIPPGQSASGFVYFQAPTNSNASSLYISGLVNASTSQDLYYFEVPL
ncbi:MAG: hypothetical protein M3N54_12915 [Acidobacteriota bacterium]|nr:hypothetical protein [Acidobacteriota bacterium]